ncbi:MAG: GNAT family N-acetyltransferase, partial [Proteobacteria bacterium]|nr:GNAT family N-acetyltransferase [Pseudomonadota bacterium]
DIFKPPQDDPELAAFFQSIISRENNVILVAYIKGAPAGYIWAAFEKRPDNPLKYGKRRVTIHQIAVHANHRKKKIGTALFQEIQELAKMEGIDHFEMDSWAFNTDAHLFFQKLGFETFNIKMWRKPGL